MGKEMEWKLRVDGAAGLDELLRDPAVLALAAEPVRLIHMQTTYYDTPSHSLGAKRMTVRRRMENGVCVVCIKAPLPNAENPHEHGEWETEAEDIFSALPVLVSRGAPEAVLEAGPLGPVCGAAFCRRAMLLRFDDGSESELACDLGTLYGMTRHEPLCEAELEMKRGAPGRTLELLAALSARYGLSPLEKSKYARAVELT